MNTTVLSKDKQSDDLQRQKLNWLIDLDRFSIDWLDEADGQMLVPQCRRDLETKAAATRQVSSGQSSTPTRITKS